MVGYDLVELFVGWICVECGEVCVVEIDLWFVWCCIGVCVDVLYDCVWIVDVG